MILFLDETILAETPSLRAVWSRVSEKACVPITGNRGKRALYGGINVKTGTPEAQNSQRLVANLGIELRGLPVACSELNPVDHFWRLFKQDVLANEPTPDLDAAVERACRCTWELSPQE